MRNKLKDWFRVRKEDGAFIEAAKSENILALRLIFITGIAILFFSLFINYLLGTLSTYRHIIELIIAFVLSALYYILGRKDYGKNVIGFLYVFIALVLVMATYFDTIFSTDSISFMFMLMLVCLPSVLMDRPWRVYLLIVLAAAFFAVHDVVTKDGEVLFRDMANLFVCVALSVVQFSVAFRYRIARLAQNNQTEKTAEHDKLTGIYNRWGGENLIKNYVSNHLSGTLMIIDVDDFKHVNDTYGHAVGDDVLKCVADTLTAEFRESDVVMRAGGDEFVVYAVGMADRRFAEERLNTISQKMHEIHPDDNLIDTTTVSIGSVINDGSYPDYETLFAKADELLYETKQNGKDGYRILSVGYKG